MPNRFATVLIASVLSWACVAAQAQPAPGRADVFEQGSHFVRSYADYSPQWLIAHWDRDPICLRIVGLPPEQAAAVKARIQAVAETAALGEQLTPTVGGAFSFPSGCRKTKVEIGFTTDPQKTLDELSAHKGWVPLRGDGTSDTPAPKTVTRPIQAWYTTYSARDFGPPCKGDLCRSGDPLPRGFDNIVVIVDLRRTGTVISGPITDYVAMLVMSQPGSLDRCNTLPSVTDLFACPGRKAPDGLTQADAAFLRALYTSNDEVYADGQPSVVGERMARILAMTKVAAR